MKKKLSSLIIFNYLYSFYFQLYSMYQLNDMAFYMLHFLSIKASVNIFNVNIKLKMPPTKRILDLKDSHQQSMLSYLPLKRLEANDEEKENNTVKSLLEHHLKVTCESSIDGSLYMLRNCLRS